MTQTSPTRLAGGTATTLHFVTIALCAVQLLSCLVASRPRGYSDGDIGLAMAMILGTTLFLAQLVVATPLALAAHRWARRGWDRGELIRLLAPLLAGLAALLIMFAVMAVRG